MAVKTCFLESVVSYHYPSRTEDKTRGSQEYSHDNISLHQQLTKISILYLNASRTMLSKSRDIDLFYISAFQGSLIIGYVMLIG